MEIINQLYANKPLLLTAFGFLGLIIGSFLNVIIYRLPIILKMEYERDCLEQLEQKPQIFNIIFPRSHCPKCKNIVLWWQNIPVISYIMLGGKCKYCKNSISWQYPIVELLTAIATIVVVSHFGAIHAKTFPLLLLTWSLIAAIFIDLKHQLLPDIITIPLIWLGLLVNTSYIFTSPQNAIIGAIIAYLSLWIIAKLFKMIRKIDGMGYGDFKLFAVFGAWLGWQILPAIILAASFAGIIIGTIWIITKKYFFTKPLPFGPFLATAGWLAFFWGNSVIKLYGNWII